MKRAIILAAILLLGCKNPFSFEPHDRNKTDPPAPPVPTVPSNGKFIKNWAYPQDVTFRWQPVSGTQFYQVEAYTDSILIPDNMCHFEDKIPSNEASITFHHYGTYWWHVRSYSPNWKWYTDWSELYSFILPNPAD